MYLPKRINEYIKGLNYQIDQVGMSSANVLLFENMVLKVQPKDEESENESNMLCWLNGKLPVPKVLCYETEGDKAYLLMSRCEGEALSSAYYMERPAKQAHLLAEAFQLLWSVDITDCPSDCTLHNKLVFAHQNVERNEVDVEDAEPGTYGENGFKDPADLFDWLDKNRPVEKLVLSHGDCCLPNIIAKDGHITGFIDLGKCGTADKWCDIALAYRSISHNFNGCYGGKVYSGYDKMSLFHLLSLKPDWEKIRYYILLDELF